MTFASAFITDTAPCKRRSFCCDVDKMCLSTFFCTVFITAMPILLG